MVEGASTGASVAGKTDASTLDCIGEDGVAVDGGGVSLSSFWASVATSWELRGVAFTTFTLGTSTESGR